MTIQIKIPFKTPTVNHLYTRNRFGNQCKTGEANKLKKTINQLIQDLKISTGPYQEKQLDVTIEVYENWFTKQGKVKKIDVANREKFQIDSVFEALGLDDKFIFYHKMLKMQSNEEYSLIKIKVMDEI